MSAVCAADAVRFHVLLSVDATDETTLLKLCTMLLHLEHKSSTRCQVHLSALCLWESTLFMCPGHSTLKSGKDFSLSMALTNNYILCFQRSSANALTAGVLELVDFIRKENIKTLVEHIVDQHIER